MDSLEVVLFINGESSIRLNRASGIRARVINPATGATMFRAPLAQVGRSAAVRPHAGVTGTVGIGRCVRCVTSGQMFRRCCGGSGCERYSF